MKLTLIYVAVLLLFGIPPLQGKTRKANAMSRDNGNFRVAREAMVSGQIEARGVKDFPTLKAMREVPRHEFVPKKLRTLAYSDHPLSIGSGQTISQPYIVAFMTEALELKPGDSVLEIGTGSGYQAAVLARITPKVFSVEILCGLERSARKTLDRLGYGSVKTRCADGYRGWPGKAPFDAIIITAAPDHIPGPLLEQLKEGGRLVMPVGTHSQELIRVRKTKEGFAEERLLSVIFVPMTGEAQGEK